MTQTQTFEQFWSRVDRSSPDACWACPMDHWRSDPLNSEEAAREALRAHVNEHRHGDLVGFIVGDGETDRYLHRYRREEVRA
jgi:hypothetical protein